MKLTFINASAYTDEGIICANVVTENGKIVRITDTVPEDSEVFDCGGRLLAPGYIDLHVHGGGGRSVMEGTADAILSMAQAHFAFGTTSILPTTLSMPVPDMKKAGDAIISAMKRETPFTILGVHHEGPCLSPAQGGAQSTDALKIPAQTDLTDLIEGCSELKMMGVAPELEGAYELADRLSARGVVVSAAHSDAEYAQVEAGIPHGFSDVTHLYSGCSMVVRKNAFRVAGVVEAGLYFDSLTTQVIADGCHLPLSLLKLIYKCKGKERMYPVTDGLEFSAADIKEGQTVVQRNGQACIYEDGVMKLPDRKAFAGSVATMSRLVRVLVKAGIPVEDALYMASATPAKRLGLTNKEHIRPGCDADMVLLDKDLFVKKVIAKGVVYDGRE